jgi:extracellular factor (EF) 3-hydroxypalmitic acid methyl ester biosynthesis protein
VYLPDTYHEYRLLRVFCRDPPFRWQMRLFGSAHRGDVLSMTDPASVLVSASSRFTTLAGTTVSDATFTLHEIGAAISTLCLALAHAEQAGLSRDTIRGLIQQAREVHALSPFVRRLQSWPRGYPGDFETVEHLINQDNRARSDALGFAIEQYCLGTPLAQQHRNKMQRQATEILQVILREGPQKPPAILVLAAGASPDVRHVANVVGSREFRIVLNDTDPGAIEFSTKALSNLGERLITLEGDVVWCAQSIEEHGPYDLIVAGGLFDYLDDKWSKRTLSLALNEWLAPGGKLFFTNIATGNPYRLWMTCVADWFVIERTEQDLTALITSVGAKDARVDIERDATSLALLASVQRVT